MSVAAPRLAADRISDVWFFPARWGVIDHAAAQAVTIDEGGITLRIARGALPDGPATDLDGVLVMRERLDQGLVTQAFAIRATAAPEVLRRPRGALSRGRDRPGPRRRAHPESHAVRSTGAFRQGDCPGLPCPDLVGRPAAPRARLHGRRAGLVRRAGRCPDRAARGRGRGRLGLPAPVPGGRGRARLPALRARPEPLGRPGARHPADRRRPRAGGPPGLPGLLLHRRAGRGGRDALHRPVHGRGGGLRAHPAAGHRAAGLRGPRARPRPAIPGALPGPRVAAPAAPPGPLDGAAQAGARLPALRLRGLARVGGRAARPGRTEWRWS